MSWGAKGSAKGGPNPCRAIKVLAPNALVAAIIGRDGATRKQLEEDHDVHLRFSGRDEYYPGTRCRIVVATAVRTSQLVGVLGAIVTMTVEIGARETEKGSGKGGDDSVLGKEPGELVLRTALPVSVTGAIIGTRGSRIQVIRESTGAKVFLDNATYDGHQMARIIGLSHSITNAVPQILQIMEEEIPEDFNYEWALKLTFDPSSQGCAKGGGKGKDGKDGGKDRPMAALGGTTPSYSSSSLTGASAWRKRSRSPGGSGPPGGGLRPKVRREGPVPAGMMPGERVRIEDGGGLSTPPGRPGRHGGSFDSPGDGSEPEGPAPELPIVYETPAEALTHAQSIADDFPPGRMEIPHAITCDLTSSKVEQMAGNNNEFAEEVRQATGCEVMFDEERPDLDGLRSVQVQGPLPAIYTAHFMIMKRYHDLDIAQELEDQRLREELEAAGAAAAGAKSELETDGSLTEDPTKIEAMQATIAALQKQLADARASGSGGGKPTKGSGKGFGKNSGGFGKGKR